MSSFPKRSNQSKEGLCGNSAAWSSRASGSWGVAGGAEGGGRSTGWFALANAMMREISDGSSQTPCERHTSTVTPEVRP